MIVSLALFLTWFVMEPVFTEAWDNGVAPMIDGHAAARGGLRPGDRAVPQLHGRPRRSGDRRDAAPRPRRAQPRRRRRRDLPLQVLVPAFLLSEIRRGFEVGFLIFLPFLVIDLVIAAILMSMGMMMVPPAVVSLPFKLAFFVIADGWRLLAGAMVRSYAAMSRRRPRSSRPGRGPRAAPAGAARRADAEPDREGGDDPDRHRRRAGRGLPPRPRRARHTSASPGRSRGLGRISRTCSTRSSPSSSSC